MVNAWEKVKDAFNDFRNRWPGYLLIVTLSSLLVASFTVVMLMDIGLNLVSFFAESPSDPFSPENWWNAWYLGTSLIGWMLLLAFFALLSDNMGMLYARGEEDLFRIFEKAARRTFARIAAGIIVILLIIVSFLLSMLLFSLLNPIFILLGILFLIVVTLAIVLAFAAANYFIAVRGEGAVNSLKRSYTLFKEKPKDIIKLVITIWAVSLVLSIPISVLGFVIGAASTFLTWVIVTPISWRIYVSYLDELVE